MLKRMLIATAVLASAALAPALAKDVTVTLNDEEQKGFIQLMDAATRANGLQVAENAIYFVKKLQAAAVALPPVTVAPAPAEPAQK